MSVGNVNLELERGSVGWGLRSVKQRIKYSDMTDSSTTGSIQLHKDIPAYSMVIMTKVTVHTGFTGGANTTATLKVGATAGEDDWSDATTIAAFTAGTVMENPENDLEIQSSAAEVHARITVSSDWTTISAGEMTIEVFYFSTVPELD